MIRRLILKLDPRCAEHLELTIYAAMARALDAELLAQLEEDENLDELAALPFITEICRTGAVARPLNRDSLHRRNERLMRRLRAELEEIARHSPLHWQLVRTRRSEASAPDPDTALLRAAQPPRTASTAASVKPHMAVIHSGDEASERALAYARRIADSERIPLLLLALPSSPWHRAHSLPEGVSVRTDLVGYDSASLRPMLRAWQVGLIVIPAERFADPQDEERLARQLPGVALLITP